MSGQRINERSGSKRAQEATHSPPDKIPDCPADESAVENWISSRMIRCVSRLGAIHKARVSGGDEIELIFSSVYQSFGLPLGRPALDGCVSSFSKHLAMISLNSTGEFYPQSRSRDLTHDQVMRVVSHSSGQISKLWSNFSMIFELFRIPISPTDLRAFAACAFVWALVIGVEASFKYSTAAIFNHWMRQTEQPKSPGLGEKSFLDLFPRHRRTLSRLRFCHSLNERYSFAYSILQVKKGTDPLPDWLVEDGLRVTAERLGTPPVNQPLERQLLIAIRRVVNETFHRLGASAPVLMPSASGHIESKRSTAGAAGYLYSEDLCVGDFGQEDPSLLERLQTAQGELLVRRYPPDFLSEVVGGADLSRLQMDPEARLSCVHEAFKLRSVTSGHARDYYLGKYLCKNLHAQVGRTPWGRFTHEPVSVDYLPTLWADEQLASIDYVDATNLMFGHVTDFCWKQICVRAGLSDWVYVWGRSSLTQNTVIFPSGLRVKQENGQLMGNPLSFLILCVINEACLRLIEQRSVGRWLSMHETRTLVNGDDGVVPIRERDYPYARLITAAAGLRFSVGKNYLSRDFAMINSCLIRYRTVGMFHWREPYEIVAYFNVGLVKGTGRVLTKPGDRKVDGVEWLSQAGQCARALVKFAPSREQAKRWLGTFLTWNKAKLNGSGRDFYLPTNLGGLGLPWLLDGPMPAMSKHAALVASYAQSKSGVNLGSDTEAISDLTKCSTSTYRDDVPMTRIDAGEFPDIEARDDSVYFWRVDLDQKVARLTDFWRLHRQAKVAGVAPLRERVTRSWCWLPEFQIRQQKVDLTFLKRV
jgi:hypothetical protein